MRPNYRVLGFKTAAEEITKQTSTPPRLLITLCTRLLSTAIIRTMIHRRLQQASIFNHTYTIYIQLSPQHSIITYYTFNAPPIGTLLNELFIIVCFFVMHKNTIYYYNNWCTYLNMILLVCFLLRDDFLQICGYSKITCNESPQFSFVFLCSR